MLLLLMLLAENDEQRRILEEAYDKYNDKMMRVARRILPANLQAEDSVQKSRVKIVEHFPKFAEIPRDEQWPWIVTIVKNTSLDMIRAESRVINLEDDWDVPGGTEPPDEDSYRRLVELIRSMPPQYRSILELKFVHEMRNKEIAKMLGLTEGTVAMRVRRGRELLFQRLNEEGYVRG